MVILPARLPQARCARVSAHAATTSRRLRFRRPIEVASPRSASLPTRAAKKGASASQSTTKKPSNQKPAGPPPPAEAEASSSNGAKTGDPAEAAQEGEEEEEQLAASERLLQAIQAEDIKEAESLANSVIKEQQALAAAVETAEADTKATKKTLDQLKDQYRRLQADFDNFRSRADNEKAQTGKNVKMSVVQDLLPLVDNFESAASQIKPANEAEHKINNSYQGLYRQMVDIFKGMGLEAVPTVGSPFDPEIHDGIMKEETTEPDNTVLEEFRKGFMFSGKLLRPAMVKVGVNSSGADAAPTEDSSAEDTSASASEGEGKDGKK